VQRLEAGVEDEDACGVDVRERRAWGVARGRRRVISVRLVGRIEVGVVPTGSPLPLDGLGELAEEGVLDVVLRFAGGRTSDGGAGGSIAAACRNAVRPRAAAR